MELIDFGYAFCPHPQPFSLGEKGAGGEMKRIFSSLLIMSLSPRERARVRVDFDRLRLCILPSSPALLPRGEGGRKMDENIFLSLLNHVPSPRGKGLG
jgi:hypothetical protein